MSARLGYVACPRRRVRSLLFASAISAALALLEPGTSRAQQLFGGVSVGESPSQVEHAFPGAVQGDGSSNEAGDRDLLKFTGTLFESYRGQENFAFDNGKLAVETIFLVWRSNGDRVAEDDVRIVLAHLKKRYGRPVYCSVGVDSEACNWIDGDLFVGGLFYFASPHAIIIAHRVLPTDHDLCHLYAADCRAGLVPKD